MGNAPESPQGRTSDAVGGGVGIVERRELPFEFGQLPDRTIMVAVCDLRRSLHEIRAFVARDVVPRLFHAGPRRRLGHGVCRVCFRLSGDRLPDDNQA